MHILHRASDLLEQIADGLTGALLAALDWVMDKGVPPSAVLAGFLGLVVLISQLSVSGALVVISALGMMGLALGVSTAGMLAAAVRSARAQP